MSDERDELALELFIADNFNQPREQSIVDWKWFTETPRFAVRVERYKAMAEGAIAAGFGSQHDAWDRCVNHVIASCTYVTSTAEEWRHKRLYSDLCEVRDSNPYQAPKVSET